ncbi:MAG TPA: hypothetical protein VN888_26600, partial [Mycobacterium sp.]|nr:hypothetical protein [Mycobacterium sp.]
MAELSGPHRFVAIKCRRPDAGPPNIARKVLLGLDKLLRKLADNGHRYGDAGGGFHRAQFVVSGFRIDVDPAEGGLNSAQVIGIPRADADLNELPDRPVYEHQLLAAVNCGKSPDRLAIGNLNGNEPEISVKGGSFVEIGHTDGEPSQSVKCHVMLLCGDPSVAV